MNMYDQILTDEWIEVSCQLPPEGVEVLAIYPCRYGKKWQMLIDEIDENGRFVTDRAHTVGDSKIAYWRRLPEVPVEIPPHIHHGLIDEPCSDKHAPRGVAGTPSIARRFRAVCYVCGK